MTLLKLHWLYHTSFSWFIWLGIIKNSQVSRGLLWGTRGKGLKIVDLGWDTYMRYKWPLLIHVLLNSLLWIKSTFQHMQQCFAENWFSDEDRFFPKIEKHHFLYLTNSWEIINEIYLVEIIHYVRPVFRLDSSTQVSFLFVCFFKFFCWFLFCFCFLRLSDSYWILKPFWFGGLFCFLTVAKALFLSTCSL